MLLSFLINNFRVNLWWSTLEILSLSKKQKSETKNIQRMPKNMDLTCIILSTRIPLGASTLPLNQENTDGSWIIRVKHQIVPWKLWRWEVDVIQIGSHSMSFFDIDFKNKIIWVWTTLTPLSGEFWERQGPSFLDKKSRVIFRFWWRHTWPNFFVPRWSWTTSVRPTHDQREKSRDIIVRRYRMIGKIILKILGFELASF